MSSARTGRARTGGPSIGAGGGGGGGVPRAGPALTSGARASSARSSRAMVLRGGPAAADALRSARARSGATLRREGELGLARSSCKSSSSRSTSTIPVVAALGGLALSAGGAAAAAEVPFALLRLRRLLLETATLGAGAAVRWSGERLRVSPTFSASCARRRFARTASALRISFSCCPCGRRLWPLAGAGPSLGCWWRDDSGCLAGVGGTDCGCWRRG